MRAYIKIWGSEYPVMSVSWKRNGEFDYVTFADEDDNFHIVHQKRIEDDLEAEHNRYSSRAIFTDLKKKIFWQKNNSR